MNFIGVEYFYITLLEIPVWAVLLLRDNFKNSLNKSIAIKVSDYHLH